MKKHLQILLLLTAFASVAWAQAPAIQDIHYGSWIKIVQSPVGNNHRVQFPVATTFDVQSGSSIIKKTLLNWSSNADVVAFPSLFAWAGSTNEGVTFNSPSPTQTSGTGALDLGTTFKRISDGVVVAIPLYFGNSGANPTPPLAVTYFTSTNNGTSWSRQTNGTVSGFPTGYLVAGFHFHRGVVQDADGTLWASAYAQFNPNDGSGYQSHRVVLVKSTNGGVAWTYVNTVQYTAGIDYTESTMARCKDGSLLVIMRNDPNSLKYRRSSDNGVTWTTVTYVPGLATNQGVDPLLELMPNGVLVLTYGDNVATHDRTCRIAYDVTGNGTNFTNSTATFTSSVADGKSTGYMAHIPTRNNQFLQVSDRGTYAYYGTDTVPSPNLLSLWTKKIETVLNYRNRIDLKTKYPASQVTVNTDMTYADVNHPETGVSGAFDASTDYCSSAIKMSNSGTYTIDLLQPYRLNGFSLCLLKGVPQTATVQYSVDNVKWATVKSYSNVTHYTVDYDTINNNPARYVKITVSGTAGKVGVTEINLFRTADTYEDYVYGIAPYGYTPLNATAPGFWVTEGVTPLPSGYQSQRALFMDDEDSGNKTLTKNGFTASATQTLDFKLRVKAYAATGGATQFILVSGSTTVFHLAVFPSGVIKYYNGAWNNVGSGTASIPIDTWKSVQVVANASTNTASVYVDGTLIGSNVTKESGTGPTTIDGFAFGSGGSAPIGDKALFDDVALYDQTKTTIADAPQADDLGALIKQNDTNTGAMSVMASPNPAGPQVRLIVKNITPGKLDFFVTNIFGKQLKKVSVNASATAYTLDMQIADLPIGVYVITVQQNGKIVQTKLDKREN